MGVTGAQLVFCFLSTSQVTWLKLELCRLLEERRSSVLRFIYSFPDVTEALAQVGLESSNLIVGIDFTKSNEWIGEVGTSGFCLDTGEKVVSNFSKFDISNTSRTGSKEDNEPGLWLDCRETEGSNSIYPCDLIPFTRRPLFLVVDSSVSYAFKAGLFNPFTLPSPEQPLL
ncbi:uncharacterized protein LOC133899017 isoform X2 [Phragmites australis]|uniref:uncharacterized protein LOC133899017 isoform X2 n=1 Tax=Phragmites australis TaxID=29695 RepID=UPI002D7A0580|nr:uncharacterized protein LOC133899017 isoform X2 [Phragmites australis]